jgi:hypothetical protein
MMRLESELTSNNVRSKPRASLEVRGFEPRSKSFLVNILRAQLAEGCRDRHYC